MARVPPCLPHSVDGPELATCSQSGGGGAVAPSVVQARWQGRPLQTECDKNTTLYRHKGWRSHLSFRDLRHTMLKTHCKDAMTTDLMTLLNYLYEKSEVTGLFLSQDCEICHVKLDDNARKTIW